MIGPHEGRELELMLAGKKPLAVFHDVVPEKGAIPEGIIPEQAFAQHVAKGALKRFSEDIYSEKLKRTVRHVCFTLPAHEWRAEFFLWYCRQLLTGQMEYSDQQEYIIGGLLGYSADDIAHFIEHKNNFKTKKTVGSYSNNF